MHAPDREPGGRRDVAIAVALIVLGLLVGVGAFALVGPREIAAAYDGASSWSRLNALVEQRRAIDPEHRDLAYFQWIGRTVVTRGAITWTGLVLLGLAWRRRRAVRAVLARFMSGTEGPLNPAVARVAVFSTLLLYTGKMDLPHYSGLPAELHFPPTGLGPLLALLPASPEIADVAVPLFQVLAAAAALGLLTRWTAPATILLALYVFGVPQMFGKVNHCHHLIWFGAVLSVAPCADTFSLDALVRRWRGRTRDVTPGRRYALPMRFIWMLLALVYFFPGFWKIWMGGIDWIVSDHLRFQMYHLWSTHDTWRPVIDPSGSPWLCHAGAASVIAFEMSYPLLILSRRTRLVVLVLGLSFHTLSALTLNIMFGGLILCYVVLVDWSALAQRIRPARGAPADAGSGDRPARLRVIAAVGVLMIVPNVVMGVAGNNNGWPFACYPRFSYPIFRPERNVIEFELVRPDGTVVAGDLDVVRGRFRTARWIGLVRSILADPDAARRDDRLRALCLLAVDDPGAYDAIRFHRATYSTIPADRGDPPLERALLRKLDLRRDG
jgi:hypothetical protein